MPFREDYITMKKISVLLLTVLLTFLFSSVPVLAEDSSSTQDDTLSAVHAIAAFGDSIPAGYGLPGFNPRDLTKATGSFPNLLADHYQLNKAQQLHNYSVTGITSSDILLSVKNADKDILRETDMIIICSGSNDIINTVGEAMYSAYAHMADDFTQAEMIVDFSDLNTIERSLLSLFMDSSKKELLDRFMAECTTEQVLNRCEEAVLQCEANLKETIAYLREIGAEAPIFVLTSYSPFEAMLHNRLTDELQHITEEMEKRYLSLAQSAEYGYNVSVIDLVTGFKDKYLELTNITSLDMHPSAAGHQYIADAIIHEMEQLSVQKQTSIQLQQHKTAPVDNIIVYMILGIAGIAVAFIIAHGIMIHRKK